MERINQPGRTELLSDILDGCPIDSAGMYEIGEQRLDLLERRLTNLHLLLAEPDESQLNSGITLARQLKEAHTLGDRLYSFEFVSEAKARPMVNDNASVFHMWLRRPLYADPTKILGAESFGSWMGRGQYGQGEVSIRERPGKRSSFEQIVDYATRDTQLPYLSADGGLNLLLGRDEPFFFSSNSHRAAAAKLRNEPLGFRRLTVYTAAD